MRTQLLPVLALSVLAAACGTHNPNAGTTPTTGSAAVAVLPDIPWEKMDHEQREQFMTQTVMPAMQPIFQQHDAKRFADFGCVTCHGERAKHGDHEMPNADLPVLNFSDMSKWKPEDLEWMGKQVEPTMAGLLKQPVYTPENPKGFGCLNCHTQAK